MSQLRKKIEADPKHPRDLLSEPGVGYRFSMGNMKPSFEGGNKIFYFSLYFLRLFLFTFNPPIHIVSPVRIQEPGVNFHFSTGNQQTDQITAGELPLLHEGESLPPFHRLIVLLPPCELDEIGLASKIWRLGKGQEIAVLSYLVVDNTRDESRMRWKSSALAALIRDEHIQVTTRLCSRKCWASDLGKLLRED